MDVTALSRLDRQTSLAEQKISLPGEISLDRFNSEMQIMGHVVNAFNAETSSV